MARSGQQLPACMQGMQECAKGTQGVIVAQPEAVAVSMHLEAHNSALKACWLWSLCNLRKRLLECTEDTLVVVVVQVLEAAVSLGP